MRRQSGWLLALAAGLVVSAISGCGERHILQNDQVKYPAAVKLYQSGCITCHGDHLQGGIGPNLQHVGSKLSRAQMARIISNGSGAMPAYALSGDAILTQRQIQTLTAWLSTKK